MPADWWQRLWLLLLCNRVFWDVSLKKHSRQLKKERKRKTSEQLCDIFSYSSEWKGGISQLQLMSVSNIYQMNMVCNLFCLVGRRCKAEWDHGSCCVLCYTITIQMKIWRDSGGNVHRRGHVSMFSQVSWLPSSLSESHPEVTATGDQQKLSYLE